jgi:hypothetical protein
MRYALIIPYPTGRFFGGRFPRHFVPGYDRTVPPGRTILEFCCLDVECVILNTALMSITSKAIQDLLDELEASKQSRLRAWKVLQKLRLVLSKAGNVTIPPAADKTFDAEGEALEGALTKSLRIRNEAIKSLCSSIRRFRDATIKEDCKRDYPYALHALSKALEWAENLIQS